MTSKTTSFNRHKLKTVLKQNAHFRNVRQTSRKRISKDKVPFGADDGFERELQSFLHDILVQVSSLKVQNFLVAWTGERDDEQFDIYTQLFSRCLEGRWSVVVVENVDGEGVPGWRISQL